MSIKESKNLRGKDNPYRIIFNWDCNINPELKSHHKKLLILTYRFKHS